MARRPRIDFAGYHHIVNRGVNRTNIFATPQDKEMFLAIFLRTHDFRGYAYLSSYGNYRINSHKIVGAKKLKN